MGLIWGVIGLLVGLVVGWGLLRPDPDPAEVLTEVRSNLASAAGTLEVVEIEYGESVEDGEIVASPEFEGARDALASSRSTYAEARPAVAAINEGTAAAIDDGYDAVEDSIESRADEAEVSTLITELRASLSGALGG